MTQFLTDFFEQLWMILRESSVWLILGFALAGVVHAFVPKDLLLKHLGGRGWGSIAKASLLGIPLPLCSCSVIPVASGLRRGGAGKGASAAFAISTPQTGEESIPLTWGLFGPVYAFTRPIVAVITGFAAGTLINAFTTERAGDESARDNGHDHACCNATKTARDASTGDISLPTMTEEPAPTIASRTRVALTHGFGTMLTDLAHWLAIGILLAAIIGALVPQGWIEQHVGTGILPKLAMLVVGIPLYICATSSTPLAYSLVVAGLSPGAALVLLLSGPATNTATMAWALKELGVRALAIYLATIGVLSLAAGIAFDALLSGTITLAASTDAAAQAGAWGATKDIGAVLMIVLLAWALGRKANGLLASRGLAPTNDAEPHACCSTPEREA